MNSDLRSKTISGMIWSSTQRFGTMLISFISNIVLARLLSPEDFGCIGMLMIFVDVANAFIDGGFGSAMIQKKKPTIKDYSTIFYWNLILSIVVFGIFYFCSPFIAQFYKIPLLRDVLRVQGIVLIFNALCMIQINLLYKQLNFRLLAKVSLMSTAIASIMGILLAYYGLGVWSLVAKMLVLSFVQCLMLWVISKWRPVLVFSWQSFRELFGFGGLLLLTYILDTIYINIQSLIIGRFYSSRDLGFYTQARKLEEIPTVSLSTVVNQVSFPIFSQLQDDKERLKSGMRKCIKSISFLNFPLMVLLIFIAKPLILLLFTEKWINSVPYFQILCVWGMLTVVNTGNLNLLRALRRSDIFFSVQLLKQIIGICIICMGLQFGIFGMMWGIVMTSVVAYFINAYALKKIINYGIGEQLRDIAPNYLLSIFAGIILYFCSSFIECDFPILLMLVRSIIYGGIYIGLAYVFNLDGFLIYFDIIRSKLLRS